MYVCMYVNSTKVHLLMHVEYVIKYICIYVCVSTNVRMLTYVCMCASTYVRMNVYTVCMLYVCMYVFVHFD